MRFCLPFWPSPPHARSKGDTDGAAAEFLRDLRDSGYVSPQDGGAAARVSAGTPAEPGAWPNFALVWYKIPAKRQIGYCGGTIIDREWVLTSAGCAGVKGAQYAVTEGLKVGSGRQGVPPPAEGPSSTRSVALSQSGRVIGVRDVVVHEQFGAGNDVHLNDIALVHLARPASTQGQALVGRDARATYLAPGRLATVVGYGDTTADAQFVVRRPVQADLSVVAQETCKQQYSDIGDFALCGEFSRNGQSICSGDPGGPLLARDELKQPVQIGIVSGVASKCGEGQYASFTSVGFFEDWIREHVPNARFVSPAVASANPVDHSLRAIAGIDPSGRPGKLAQVSIDLQPRDRVRLGDAIMVEVTRLGRGPIDGLQPERRRPHLSAVSQYGWRRRPHSARPRRDHHPGRRGHVSIPGPDDGFDLTASPPTGKNRIIAIVVPAGLPLGVLLAALADMQRIDDPDALINELSSRAARGPRAQDYSAPKNNAVAVHEYEIVE